MMKKLLLALALVSAFGVHAENWVRVTDSDKEDTRLFVDIDTFEMGTNKEGVNYVGAGFRLVQNGEPQTTTAFLTDPTSCPGGGKMVGRQFQNGSWTTVETHFWSPDGNRFYDYIGVTICTIKQVREERKTPGSKPQKPAAKNTI